MSAALPVRLFPATGWRLLAAAVLALSAVGCGSGESSSGTELILLNGNRVSDLTLTIVPSGGSGVTVPLPAGDQPNEPYGPAVRRSYSVDAGDVFEFTATVGSLTQAVQCTVTEAMITEGFAVVGVYAVPSQSAIDIICNWG